MPCELQLDIYCVFQAAEDLKLAQAAGSSGGGGKKSKAAATPPVQKPMFVEASTCTCITWEFNVIIHNIHELDLDTHFGGMFSVCTYRSYLCLVVNGLHKYRCVNRWWR